MVHNGNMQIAGDVDKVEVLFLFHHEDGRMEVSRNYQLIGGLPNLGGEGSRDLSLKIDVGIEEEEYGS